MKEMERWAENVPHLYFLLHLVFIFFLSDTEDGLAG